MRNVSECRVIAHRGASKYFPENTVLSFKKAIEMGAHMLELDVSFTKDKVPVVIHDEKVDRTSDGKGRVSEFTYKQLRALDAGKWKDSIFTNERIPSLEETLEICRDVIPVNIEIKTESVSDIISGGIEEAVLGTVHRTGMYGKVIISSFDPRAMKNLHKIDSTVPSAILYAKVVQKGKTPAFIANELECGSFNCSLREINRKWIDDCKNALIDINVYTVDSAWKMKKLFLSGVKGIFSNRPDILLNVYESLLQSGDISY